MTGRDFLTVARILAARPEEAAWRSSVSRAYYAAFHAARDLLTDLGFHVPQADRAHGYLWLRLQNCGNAAVEHAGRNLGTLRQLRNRADYDLLQPVLQPFAQTQLTAAEAIILAVEAAALDPVRSQITTAMRNYEANVLRQVTWYP